MRFVVLLLVACALVALLAGAEGRHHHSRHHRHHHHKNLAHKNLAHKNLHHRHHHRAEGVTRDADGDGVTVTSPAVCANYNGAVDGDGGILSGFMNILNNGWSAGKVRFSLASDGQAVSDSNPMSVYEVMALWGRKTKSEEAVNLWPNADSVYICERENLSPAALTAEYCGADGSRCVCVAVDERRTENIVFVGYDEAGNDFRDKAVHQIQALMTKADNFLRCPYPLQEEGQVWWDRALKGDAPNWVNIFLGTAKADSATQMAAFNMFAQCLPSDSEEDDLHRQFGSQEEKEACANEALYAFAYMTYFGVAQNKEWNRGHALAQQLLPTEWSTMPHSALYRAFVKPLLRAGGAEFSSFLDNPTCEALQKLFLTSGSPFLVLKAKGSTDCPRLTQSIFERLVNEHAESFLSTTDKKYIEVSCRNVNTLAMFD